MQNKLAVHVPCLMLRAFDMYMSTIFFCDGCSPVGCAHKQREIQSENVWCVLGFCVASDQLFFIAPAIFQKFTRSWLAADIDALSQKTFC